jgi:acyl-CoA thioesterase-1
MVLFLGLCALSASATERTLLVMGDSLSAAYGLRSEQGWVALLEQRLIEQQRGWRVVNASISGETTDGGAARIDSEIATHAPDLVIIELGANDGLRGLPLQHARTNLERMIEAAKAAGADVLLIGMRMPPNYGPAYTSGFFDLFAELAREHEAALLPFLLEPIAADRDAFLDDNLHPTAEAQPLLLDHVWPALEPLL